jgi:hypothetical protein
VFISRSDFLNDDGGSPLGEFADCAEQFARANHDVRTCEPTTLEGTLKKLAFVASVATALVCAAALVATPADAKKRAKKPAAAPAAQMAGGPGMGGPGMGGPVHQNGGPIKSGSMCWKDEGSRTQAQFGYWAACPKK